MKMELAKLTSKGQLTIPIAIRQKLCLEEGDKVVFLVDDDGVRIANAANLTFIENARLVEESQLQSAEDTVYKSKRRSVPGQKPKGK